MKSGGFRQTGFIAHAVLGLSLWLIANSLAYAAETTPTPRAQTLFNLLLFVHWPEASVKDQNLIWCSQSGSALSEMQTYSKQTIRGNALKLTQLSPQLDELDQCDVFYSAQLAAEQLRRAVVIARKKPLLIVLEGARSIEQGAMVGLDFSISPPQIYINLRMLQQSHLIAQAPLLAIAQRVIR